MEEAATKIQVETNHNPLQFSQAGYFGWKARRALAELEERDEEGDNEEDDNENREE